MQFNTISGHIVRGHIMFMLLIIASLASTFIVTQSQKNDSFAINLAGRQRALIQQISKDTLVYVTKVNKTETDIGKWTGRLSLSMRTFESTLAALKDGGTAPVNLEMTTFRELPPPDSSSAKNQLEKINAIWITFKDNITRIIETEGRDPLAVDYIIAKSDDLYMEINTAVAIMQMESEGKIRLLLAIQIVVLAVGFILLGAGSFIVRTYVVNPIVNLIKATDEITRGNLKGDLPAKGPKEIADLTAAFNKMRISLQKMLDRISRAGG